MTIIQDAATPAIHILIVDDYELMREGMKELLSNYQSSFSLTTDTAKDGAEALQKVKEQYYDLVLMDYQMPRKNGDEVTSDLLTIQPGLKVLGLSYYNDPLYMKKMRDAGAQGYVLKSIEPAELMTAIEAVLDGGNYFPF